MTTTETEFNYEEYIEELSEEEGMNAEAFATYCDNHHITAKDDIAGAVNDYHEYYIGEMTIQEYAEQLAEDLYPEAVATGYFDTDSFARDLELGGEVWEMNGHLFRSY
jgi:hypothetical protein